MNIPQPRKIPKIDITLAELQPLYNEFKGSTKDFRKKSALQLYFESNVSEHQDITKLEQKIDQLQDQLTKVTMAHKVDSILLDQYKQKCI